MWSMKSMGVILSGRISRRIHADYSARHPIAAFGQECLQYLIQISLDGAQWLIDRGIELVGVDYLGVERFESVGNGAPTHHALLKNEMVIVEGLNLSDIPAGDYTLICLPVKIKNSDGAPCRAILIKE